MASISSMISFFVLLLATYSYSAPVLPGAIAVAEYEVINATFVLRPNSTDVPVTSVPIKSGSVSSEESESDEVKKHAFTRSAEDFTRSPHTAEAFTRSQRSVEDFTRSPDTAEAFTRSRRSVEDFTRSPRTAEAFTRSRRSVEDFTRSPRTSEDFTRSPRTAEDFTRSPRTYEDSSYATATDLNESSTVEDSSSTGMNHVRGIDVSSFVDTTETTEKRDIEDSSVTEMDDKRAFEESSDSTATDVYESSTAEDSSSTGVNGRRIVEGFVYTTIESSTEFNQRAIRPVPVPEEKFESSTAVSSEYQSETTTDVEPSSSVDSFVKFTGLIRDQPSTTFEYETTSQVEEESTTELPVTSETATKILSVIPGTISKTKIVVNRPTETPVVIQRADSKQLTQAGNQSVIEETKSHN